MNSSVSTLQFANPHFLWALFCVPLFAALLWWLARRRETVLRRFVSPTMLPYLAPNHNERKSLLKAALLLLAVTSIVFAGARPQWGYEDRRVISRGIDLLVAVDTSNSMLAQDYRPSRLDRAKQLLQSVLWRARGDRVGVMAFAGNALIQCPLTLDYSMASAALATLDVNSVSAQGTAIAAAIDTAIKAFDTASAGERILVLLTDGEDQGSDTVEAAQRAAKANIRVYTIGIGTNQGMPIPLSDGNYKQDKQGRVVNSRLDFLTLQKIAQLTHGKAIKANPTGEKELDVIMNDLEALQKAEHQDKVWRVYVERYQWFLLPAILLLIWEALETGLARGNGTWKGRVANQ